MNKTTKSVNNLKANQSLNQDTSAILSEMGTDSCFTATPVADSPPEDFPPLPPTPWSSFLQKRNSQHGSTPGLYIKQDVKKSYGRELGKWRLPPTSYTTFSMQEVFPVKDFAEQKHAYQELQINQHLTRPLLPIILRNT